jgi:tetratricopeptide (TPR) repeat protein
LLASSVIAQDLTLEQRYERAARLFYNGQLSLAENEFDAIIRIVPQAAEPYYFLGRICASTDRMPDAEQWLQKAIALKPDFAEAWQSLGLVYSQQKSHAGARDAYSKVITLDPANAAAYLNLGHALENLGEDEKALSHFENALKYGDAIPPVRLQASTNLRLLRLKKAART